jgi:hypothetical protein
MVRLAVLDGALPAQFQESGQATENLMLTYSATSLDAFRREAPRHDPKILILNLDLLGDAPADTVRGLQDACRAELVIVLYNFATRALLRELTSETCKVVKLPVSLATLRSNMLGVIIRSILSGDAEQAPKELELAPKRFDAATLGRLMERASAVQCECPNHLAELVQSLGAFEDYSKNCENKSPADARIHHLLYEKSAVARGILEDALVELCRHEGISLDGI